MKEIHLRRHAEKGSDGILTNDGIERARELSRRLPAFAKVVSSDSNRTQLTAKLLTGMEAIVDTRAGFYMASSEKSDAINLLAAEHGLTFLEAVSQYQDAEVLDGIDSQANGLNQLISELLDELEEDEKALIVSHDLSINPAMAKKGMPLESIDPLEGYVLKEDGSIESTK